MNAQKEVEYIAEIVRLKSEIKKLTGRLDSGEWISAADFRKYATLQTINGLIAAHCESHQDCDYHLQPKSHEVFTTTPMATGKSRPHTWTLPPVLSVTRTVQIEE